MVSYNEEQGHNQYCRGCETCVPIRATDIVTDTFRSGISVPVTISITHLPTSLKATASHQSLYKAREEAMLALRVKLKDAAA